MRIYRSLEAIAADFEYSFPEYMYEVEKRYPVAVSEYYLSLIDWKDPFADPVFRQCMPMREELLEYQASDDPLHEHRQSPVPRLVRRYVDRAVLISTGRCLAYCRFCFRKRQWRHGNSVGDISDAELAEACDWLRRNPGVRELLVSGGDVLAMDNSAVRRILTELRKIDSLEVVRLASRAPVVMPERIDSGLLELLAGHPGLWFATHFNHPAELTGASRAACARLVAAGIPVVNQTVLLKGVNDDAAILEELFRNLVKIRVKPHYLFHIDPAEGVRHFATGIACGLDILRQLRPRLSSLATPTFAIDLPEGGGKVHLQPDYRSGDGFEAIDGHSVSYPERL